MKSDKITTLFLDIGGVLLTNGWGREERHRAIEKFNLDKNETSDRHELVWSTYESGKLDLQDYLTYVVFYRERTFSREEFIVFMMEQSQPREGAIDFFKQLKKERGFKVVALSNEARELNEYRIKKYKLDELFDFYVSSCYVHLRKPDPDIYKLACDNTQTLPGNALYIDDRLMYIEMARSLGIESLHYENLSDAKNYFKKV
ncbi:MAG: hydrolase [Bacteroidota bacterium]|nr:hydrolase [Bacteroidota bacterium]